MNVPPLLKTHCDVIGGKGDGATTALCRLVADHPDRAGAQVMVREQGSAISHMSVGICLGLGATVRPVQRIAGFLVLKTAVAQTVTVAGQPVAFSAPVDAKDAGHDAATPAFPALPEDTIADVTVPLIRLAWARSGDKGNMFNVAVIARAPEYLPSIAAALTPERVGTHYGAVLGRDQPFVVDAFCVPGLSALNFVVRDSMDGGVLANVSLDPVAKGMAQLLLDVPIAISAELAAMLGA